MPDICISLPITELLPFLLPCSAHNTEQWEMSWQPHPAKAKKQILSVQWSYRVQPGKGHT